MDHLNISIILCVLIIWLGDDLLLTHALGLNPIESNASACQPYYRSPVMAPIRWKDMGQES